MNWKLLTSNKKHKLPYSANSWSFGGCFWSTDARPLQLYERNFYICLPPWEYLSSYSWVWDGNCRPVLKVQGFQLINLWLQKFITFFSLTESLKLFWIELYGWQKKRWAWEAEQFLSRKTVTKLGEENHSNVSGKWMTYPQISYKYGFRKEKNA